MKKVARMYIYIYTHVKLVEYILLVTITLIST